MSDWDKVAAGFKRHALYFQFLSSIEAEGAKAEVYMQYAAEQVWHIADCLTDPDEESIGLEQRRGAYLSMCAEVFDRLYTGKK